MNLRANLFWDVDFQKLDKKRDAEFIIGRVLDFGNLKEWKEINNLYNALTIKKVAQKHIFTDPRSANFWSKILHIPLKKLQCTRNPLLKTPKAFLTH
jgi:hypothetical protein